MAQDLMGDAILERLRSLDPATIYPTHGEPFTDAGAALAAYLRHRRARQQQVLEALAHAETPQAIAERVYGATVQPQLRQAALGSTVACLHYLERLGRVRREGERWRRT